MVDNITIVYSQRGLQWFINQLITGGPHIVFISDFWKGYLQVVVSWDYLGGPPVISWFITPSKYTISIIHYGYYSYKPT